MLRALTSPPSPLDAEHRRALSRIDRELEDILADPNAARTIDEALTRRATTIREGIEMFRAEQRHVEAERSAQELLNCVSNAGRDLTDVERETIANLRAVRKEQDIAQGVDPGVLSVIANLRIRLAKRQLHAGLLLTAQMDRILAEARGAVRRGDPILLIGETGGAKTALAEYLARRARSRPEFISGYGDITTAQVIGAHELRAAGHATTSEFVPGPLLRAMLTGTPVILDEINAMPAEFLKRLNRLLQLRPGDTFVVQENAGQAVDIQPGFLIIATANEQSSRRYRGIEHLSAELINRFGANTYRVHYPDRGRAFHEVPTENLLLATAAVARVDGSLPSWVTSRDVEGIARAAFVSQQVFSGSQAEGFRDFVSTEREVDGRPGLEENVLAPRTVVAILGNVAGSAGEITVERALQRFVEGVMHREDRDVLTLILRGQGFAITPV